MDTNVIYNEDCHTTMLRFDERSIDLILTSPPYNMTPRKGGYADKEKKYDEYKDWVKEEDYIDWTTGHFEVFEYILKKNGVILYNFSYSIENPSLPYKIIADIIENTEFTIADTIIWKKPNAIPHPASYNRLNRIFEFVFVLCRKDELLTFNSNKKIVKTSSKGQNYYEIFNNFVTAKNNDGKTPLNKATYSTELCDKLLNIYAKDNSIVYDPFMGTGTTAISCIKRGLQFIGSEISEDQVEYATKRVQKAINNGL